MNLGEAPLIAGAIDAEHLVRAGFTRCFCRSPEESGMFRSRELAENGAERNDAIGCIPAKSQLETKGDRFAQRGRCLFRSSATEVCEAEEPQYVCVRASVAKLFLKQDHILQHSCSPLGLALEEHRLGDVCAG